MKCRECGSRYKGYWASAPETNVCVGGKEPFAIVDINAECTRKPGHWEISFDGYYPYCSECGYRPGMSELMSECPKCGVRMECDKDA